MPKLFDRVKVNIATTGTGTVTFGPASSPAFLTPTEAGAIDGNTVRYVFVDGTDFEEGIGTILASVAQMSRDTVTRSKIGGSLGAAKINLSGTAVLVFTAGAADILNPANNLSDLASAATARGNLGISATNTPFAPAGSIAATTTQAAILELDGENQSDHGAMSAAITALQNSRVRHDAAQTLSVSVQRQARENISAALRWHLVGFKFNNNVSSPNMFVDISAGECASDEANPQFIAASAMTKRLDAGWAPGTNVGMRNSAAALAPGWYQVFVVSKANGADAEYYAHTSTNIATVLAALQAESGGSDYVHARWIFALWNQSTVIRPFLHFGDTVKWITPVADYSSTAATADVLMTLSVPPGVRVRPIIHTYHFQGTAGDTYYAYADGDGSTSNTLVGRSFTANEPAISVVDVFTTNLASQIRHLVTVSAGNIGTHVVNTMGYHFARGRGGPF